MPNNLNLPTGKVTFLFSDIQGSTPLWESMPEAMGASLSQHNRIMSAAIEAYGGVWYKSVGDEIQAAFTEPLAALQAALAGQRGLQSAEWGKTGPILVRMGIHFGDAIAEAADYATTHTLNRVARIMSSAHGGQVVISQEAVLEIDGRFPEGVTLKDMGKHRMKGLSQLEHIHQVLAPDLPADFPKLKTLDISPNNLPNQLSTFFGRAKEIREVRELIGTSRLVTLTGSGGAGKTRLSLEVAETLQDAHPHGVWLVELAPQTDPDLIPSTVLQALDLTPDASRPAVKQLTDYLAARTLLLVLDNCEHLIDASAQLADTLLRACPDLRILASSREALGVPGESPYRVPSLHVPDTEALSSLEAFEAIEAIQLFMDRAKTVKNDFALSAENAPTIAHICKRLDGIPLAIELAAARVKVMQVSQISDRLDNRFRLLTVGSRTALPRQQTLRALIDWSYGLLTEPERSLLRRLSVFVGGWDLEAAETVCAGGEIESFEVLDLLTSLVDKSLINTQDTETGVRYHRLETIRQYAREKFLESDEVETLRDAHLAYFGELAETAGEELDGKNQIIWVKQLDTERDNLNAAISWATETDVVSGMRLVNSLESYLYIQFDVQMSYRWLSGLLSAADDSVEPAIHAKTLQVSMGIAAVGELEKRDQYIKKALALYESAEDEVGIAYVKLHNAWSHTARGDLEEAKPILQECLEVFERKGDIRGQVWVNNTFASVIYATSNTPLAIGYAEKILALLEISENQIHKYRVLNSLSYLYYVSGKFDEALEYLERAIHIIKKIFDRLPPQHFYDKARIFYMKGDFEQAFALFLETIARDEQAGRYREKAWSTIWLGKIAVQTGDYEKAYQLFSESFETFRKLNIKMMLVLTIEGFCELAVALGEAEQAATMMAWADASRKKIGDQRPSPEQEGFEKLWQAIQAHLSPEQVAEATARGEEMSSDQMIAFALEEVKP
jgi:predicted ATPase/class 3 adenylate cyclase